MHVKIIQIGTSKGIRLPKYLIDKYGLTNEIDMIDTGSGILIKQAKKPRDGWKKAFEKSADTEADHLIETPSSEWDKDEWEW